MLITNQAKPSAYTSKCAQTKFQLPGGGVDPNEHPIRALHREVMEETGWIIDRLAYWFVPAFCVRLNMISGRKICAVYLAILFCAVALQRKDHSDLFTCKIGMELVENPGDQYFISNFISGNVF